MNKLLHHKQQQNETNTNIKWKKSDHRNIYTQVVRNTELGVVTGKACVCVGGYFWVIGSVLFLDLGIIMVTQMCSPCEKSLSCIHQWLVHLYTFIKTLAKEELIKVIVTI